MIAPDGTVVTRYDKRFLSHTEVSWIYTPGTEPVVFEAGGLRFGCALCIEVSFPEIFADYERLDADCVLVSVRRDAGAHGLLEPARLVAETSWPDHGPGCAVTHGGNRRAGRSHGDCRQGGNTTQ